MELESNFTPALSSVNSEISLRYQDMVIQNRHRDRVTQFKMRYDRTHLHNSLTVPTKLGLAKFLNTTIQSEV